MKEFIKNLLILLSTPLYIIAAFAIGILLLSKEVGENIKNYMNEWIEFMKDDYEKVYEVIKNGFEKTKKRWIDSESIKNYKKNMRI